MTGENKYEESWKKGWDMTNDLSDIQRMNHQRFGSTGYLVGSLRNYLNTAEDLGAFEVFSSLVPGPVMMVI